MEDPTIGIREEIECLNTIGLDDVSCLRLLRTASIGGILLVTRLYDETGPTTLPPSL
jgi:hypothetical protein